MAVVRKRVLVFLGENRREVVFDADGNAENERRSVQLQ